MEMKNSIGKMILSVCFLGMIVVIGLKSKPLTSWEKVYTSLAEHFVQNDSTADNADKAGRNTMEVVKSNYSASMWSKNAWIDVNGSMAKILGQQGNYGYAGIYALNGEYIVSPNSETTTDYEYSQMVDFKKFLDEQGANLLYINNPTKYLDDNVMAKEFGVDSYPNRNADRFLERICDAGIWTVDLRNNIISEGKSIYDMFYRTDHHWNTRTGLWAANITAESLNQYCNYHIDTELYQEENYHITEYKNAWLGEQGRKVSASYAGLDDYDLIKPKFDTDLEVSSADGSVQKGTFDIMLDESRIDPDLDVYNSGSWHYAFMPQTLNFTKIHNNKSDYGNVLILCDSYAYAEIPFLALGIRDITAVIPRGYDGSIRELIRDNHYDTVIMMYAEFMIGAHDNESSANYKMFTLDD